MFKGVPKRVLFPVIALAFAGGIAAAAGWSVLEWPWQMAAVVAGAGCLAGRGLLGLHRLFRGAPISRDERIGETLAAGAMAVMGFWIGLAGVKLTEACLHARGMDWEALWG